jgi:hypothetical protein
MNLYRDECPDIFKYVPKALRILPLEIHIWDHGICRLRMTANHIIVSVIWGRNTYSYRGTYEVALWDDITGRWIEEDPYAYLTADDIIALVQYLEHYGEAGAYQWKEAQRK